MITPGMKILPVIAVGEFADKGRRGFQEDFHLMAPDKGIFVVADGFGGPVGGVEASKAACEAVRGFLVKEGGDVDATLPFVLRSYFSLAGNVLFNALIYANIKVLKLNRDKGIHEKGGASVVAGFLDGDLLALANVGGCSVWLFRGGKAVELVVPRTYARLMNPFPAAPEGGMQIPLTAMGMSEDLEPEIFEYRLQPGDWLLFQTDGIQREAIDRISRIQVSSTLGPEKAADEVVHSLSDFAGEDNATGLFVTF